MVNISLNTVNLDIPSLFTFSPYNVFVEEAGSFVPFAGVADYISGV